MVGALVLARMSEDPALSEEILRETRVWMDPLS
jgi:TetR/AcrR family transcriptional repressor of nem operon